MTDSSKENQTFINPQGIVEIILRGDQTEDKFRHTFYEVEPLIEELKVKNKPLLGLIDMTEETGYSLASDKVALELLEEVYYDKLAMCNPPHEEVTKGIILATGKSHKTKIFHSRQEAFDWLLAK